MIELFDKNNELKAEYSIPYIKSCFVNETLVEIYHEQLIVFYEFPIIRTIKSMNDKMKSHKTYNGNVLIEEFYTKYVTDKVDCPVGLFKSWHSNGIPELIQTYNNFGNLTGLIQKYYDNGQLEYLALVENNIWKGEFKNWDRDGNLITYEYRIDGDIFEIEKAKQLFKYYKELPSLDLVELRTRHV